MLNLMKHPEDGRRTDSTEVRKEESDFGSTKDVAAPDHSSTRALVRREESEHCSGWWSLRIQDLGFENSWQSTRKLEPEGTVCAPPAEHPIPPLVEI